MDPDLLEMFVEHFQQYQTPEKINRIIEKCVELRGKKANCLYFLLGSFYGSSIYMYESFVSHDGEIKKEYADLVDNHIEGLNETFSKYLKACK